MHVLPTDQDGRPRGARTSVLSRRADSMYVLKIADTLPGQPHLPM
jgi:hypothetical protein